VVADRGIVVERVFSDNGLTYAWRDACAELNITHKRTRPYRPQTNGKIERFHRTPGDGWTYAQFYQSTKHRSTALPGCAATVQGNSTGSTDADGITACGHGERHRKGLIPQAH
jgi:transposase InsO family protein